MQQKQILVRALSALILAAGVAIGAEAQVAGTYSGTSADGNFMSVTVTGTSGNFSFGDMDVNFQAHCVHPARTASEGWGFFLGTAITAGDNAYHSSNDYYDIRGSLKFLNNHKIKGDVTSVTAVFVPGDDPPAAAQFCKSAKQSFILTLQAAPIRQQLPTATVLEKRLTK